MTTFRNKCCILVFLVALLLLPNSSVGAEGEGVSLQEIVDQAHPGDTVILKPGIYQGPITINKRLTILPEEDGTIVLRNMSPLPAVTIKADNTTIMGLQIIDEMVKETPTVQVNGHHTVLESLNIQTSGSGIVVRDADDGTLRNNTIEWIAEGVQMADKGNGMDLYNGHRWNITDNTIHDVLDGIYLENSDDTYVNGNVIERSRYGVHCMYTNRTMIRQNEGKMNVTGAMVMAARQVSVIGNTFTKQSENVNSQGILLYDTHETTVSDNTVVGNRVGLYIELSTDNLLENNRVSYNFVGMQMLESIDNVVEGNQFIGNVSDAQTRGSEENRISNNYWDNFRGIDADGDGKSDISYAMNPFFQSLTQKRPAFQLFFQSPGMVFMEGLYQTERSRWTTDMAPLMDMPNSKYQQGDSESNVKTGLTGIVLLGSTFIFILWVRRRST
ncbi:right-handed parallel beta-helix repeat-containing protein [Paenibacillus solani]|uniref:right-handed parallel beta-helix repeat-containing protein n=1 Tax=Paenibacillus solani TaxID=1705565 RepID=UPI003D2C049C